jgi:peptide/nickel transport system permease protein
LRILAKRLVTAVLTLVLSSAAAFWALEAAPGNFATEAQAEGRIPQASIQEMRTRLQLDEPGVVRYWTWVKAAAAGDWGRSYATNEAVWPMLKARCWATLQLMSIAMGISWVLALGLGLLGLRRQQGWMERALESTGTVLLAIPDVVLVLGVALVYARLEQEFSIGAAPAVGLSLCLIPGLCLQVRGALREANRASFVEGARLRGLPETVVVRRYVAPAAGPALAALAGMSVGMSFSASLLVECTLGYPGLGPLLLDSILARDTQVTLGAVLMATLLWTAGNLGGDLLHVAADPRLRRSA